MANPEHVEIVKQGAAAIRKWREENPEVRLDLTEADLREADLHEAHLRGADLREAHLRRTYLGGAHLRGAHLREADLGEADLQGADLQGADLMGVNLHKADLGGARLLGVKLVGASLWEAHLGGAHLRGADLSRADLGRADLGGADLREANLWEANLNEANLRGADLAGVRGAEQAYHLETVRFLSTEDTQGSDSRNDASYFETCRRPWPERVFDWERLRVMGRLPLFGLSYTGLILITVVFYGLALYNDKIALVRAWAEQVIALPDHPWHRLAPLVLERLHPRPIPSLSLVLLVSTILLAIASTLYTWRCPSRIKEFSRDQWCDQLGRSLLHYWPLAWKERYVRLICAVCYGLGGAGALWVLGTKVWHTALFIVKHSAVPWPWR